MVDNKHTQGSLTRLDDQYAAYRCRVAGADLRTLKMLVGVGLPLLGLIYGVARLIIWQTATDSYAGFLARSLDSRQWGLAQEGLILLNQVRIGALNTLFMRLILPFCLLVIVIVFAAAKVQRRVPQMVYKKPAVVRHLLMVDMPALATQPAFIRLVGLVLLILATLCVAGVFILPTHLVTRFLIASLLLMCLTVFALGFRWIRQTDRLGAASQKVSPAYIRAACVTGAVRQLVLVFSILTLILGAWSLAKFAGRGLSQTHGAVWLPMLEKWESRLSTSSVDGQTSELLSDVGNEVRRGLERLAGAKFKNRESLGPGEIRSFAAVFLFIACAVACLDVGITLSRFEYREPTLALGLGVLAALVLSFAEGGIKAFFPSSGAFSFAAEYGVLLLTFVLGQLSAFIIRLYTQPGTECPVCLNRSESPAKCSICGLRFARAREPEYVGNSASGELHVRRCRHASKIAPESCAVFTTLEQALWAGYDLCGSCLGGSMFVPPITASKAK